MRRARPDRPTLAAAALLAGSLLLAAGCARAPEVPAGPVNVLLVTLDTVRADHLGCYGRAAAETPALDRLARAGVRFADASSPAPLTLPAHASLLSGLLPPRHGLRNNGAGKLPAEPATLASVLAAAGYRTGAFVGAFVLDSRFGLDRGFATYDDQVDRDAAGATSLESERTADQVVDRALAWLGQPEERRPFFLWVHLYDAHAPYAPPAPYAARHAGRPYDGEIAFADAQVGRLLDELERRGLQGSTVVAVAADHGEALGEHGELTHGLLLYEGTLKVPLLLAGPALEAGAVIESPASLADLGPTLAGLAGHPFPAPAAGQPPLDGRDLSAPLRAGEQPPSADLYAETQYPRLFGWSPLAALRRRGLKYIAAPRPELYDLAADPGETASLAGREAGRDKRFAARIAAIESAAVVPISPTPAAEDEEARSRLASLGYAAPAAPGETAPGERSGADPKDRVDLFRRFEEAGWALRSGAAARAAEELAALVAADPGNPVFRGKLAQALKQQGAGAEALPLYRQAAAAAPDDPDGWYNLAAALVEAGQPAEARRALAEVLRLAPSRPEAHNLLGVAHLAEGRMAEAERAFAAALALDPDNARALTNLGNVLRALGRRDEAERAYARATEIAPRSAEAWNGLGTLAVERDRPAEALPFFDRALELAPGYHEVRLNRAIAYELAGDTRAAIAAYREFLAAAGEARELAPQRRAAQQLLARLSRREAGTAPEERR